MHFPVFPASCTMRRINIGWKLIDEDHPWNNKDGRLRDYSNPKVTVSQIYSCSRDVNLDLESKIFC